MGEFVGSHAAAAVQVNTLGQYGVHVLNDQSGHLGTLVQDGAEGASASAGSALVHVDRTSGQSQEKGAGKPGRACANNGNAASIGRGGAVVALPRKGRAAFHFPDLKAIVILYAHAFFTAGLVAHGPEYGGEGVGISDDRQCAVKVAGCRPFKIGRNMLACRAAAHTGSGGAVECGQGAGRLDVSMAHGASGIAGIRRRGAGGGFGKVLQHGGCMVVQPGRLACKSGYAFCPGRVHGLAEVFHILGQATITAGLEQIRAYGQGRKPAGQGFRHVQGVHSGAERNVQPALKIVLKAAGHGDGNRVESPPAHVDHRLFFRQALAAVERLKRVGELDAKGQPQFIGGMAAVVKNAQGRVVRNVVFKGDVGHIHRVSEALVEDAAHTLRPQQGGIHLERGVEAAALQKIQCYPFHLIGRTAVHAGNGQAVAHGGGNVYVGRSGPDFCQLSLHGAHIVAAVLHAIQKALHRGAQDALHAVPGAHVENHARAARKAEMGVQNMNKYPGLEVFLIAAVQAQFL